MKIQSPSQPSSHCGSEGQEPRNYIFIKWETRLEGNVRALTDWYAAQVIWQSDIKTLKVNTEPSAWRPWGTPRYRCWVKMMRESPRTSMTNWAERFQARKKLTSEDFWNGRLQKEGVLRRWRRSWSPSSGKLTTVTACSTPRSWSTSRPPWTAPWPRSRPRPSSGTSTPTGLGEWPWMILYSITQQPSALEAVRACDRQVIPPYIITFQHSTSLLLQ